MAVPQLQKPEHVYRLLRINLTHLISIFAYVCSQLVPSLKPSWKWTMALWKAIFHQEGAQSTHR